MPPHLTCRQIRYPWGVCRLALGRDLKPSHSEQFLEKVVTLCNLNDYGQSSYSFTEESVTVVSTE